MLIWASNHRTMGLSRPRNAWLSRSSHRVGCEGHCVKRMLGHVSTLYNVYHLWPPECTVCSGRVSELNECKSGCVILRAVRLKWQVRGTDDAEQLAWSRWRTRRIIGASSTPCIRVRARARMSHRASARLRRRLAASRHGAEPIGFRATASWEHGRLSRVGESAVIWDLRGGRAHLP